MVQYGYARVSSLSQSTDVQHTRLTAAGCTKVRNETASGSKRNGRTELELIMEFIQAGDTIVVVKLDRLGRSTRDVLNLVHELEERGTAEQHIKEGKYAFRWTRLSCRRFRDNEVRLQLHALAHNLATFLRCIELPEAMADW